VTRAESREKLRGFTGVAVGVGFGAEVAVGGRGGVLVDVGVGGGGTGVRVGVGTDVEVVVGVRIGVLVDVGTAVAGTGVEVGVPNSPGKLPINASCEATAGWVSVVDG
jgi:hypothetical protein